MRVRKGPSADARWNTFSELSESDKIKALDGEDAVLAKDSVGKCIAIYGDWMRIDSGWICMRENGENYVITKESIKHKEEAMSRYYEKIGVDPDSVQKITGVYEFEDSDKISAEFFEDGTCVVHYVEPMVPVTDEEGYTNGKYAATKVGKVYMNWGGSVHANVFTISGKTLHDTSEEINLMP